MVKVFRNLSALKTMEDNNILENYGLLILNEEIKSSILRSNTCILTTLNTAKKLNLSDLANILEQ